MTTYSMLQSATNSYSKFDHSHNNEHRFLYYIRFTGNSGILQGLSWPYTYTFNCSVLCTVISSVQYLAGQAVTSIIILIVSIHHQNILMASYVILHSPQLESPLPRCFMMRFCIQNASQRHCRVTWSQTPWPVWHKPQHQIPNTNTMSQEYFPHFCTYEKCLLQNNGKKFYGNLVCCTIKEKGTSYKKLLVYASTMDFRIFHKFYMSTSHLNTTAFSTFAYNAVWVQYLAWSLWQREKFICTSIVNKIPVARSLTRLWTNPLF